MKKGDVVINPWVSKTFNGYLNPMYATIYIGNNMSVDYRGRKHKWGDRISKPEKCEREWKVIGHVDIDLFKMISDIVNEENLAERKEE